MANLDTLLAPPKPILTQDYVPSNVPCSFVTGAAGTGKTYNQMVKIQEDPSHAILTATTGIAAINLGTNTLNSVLKYFDTDSLRERLGRGFLTSMMGKIGKQVRNIVVDEVSMMDGRQLDYIHKAVSDANEFKYMEGRPLGLILTGDFCQLPPVKAPWAFEADCWEQFERGTTVLSKMYRQSNPDFLAALNAARSGDGSKAAGILKDIGVKFIPATKPKFDGTTILSKNAMVDNFNFSALLDLPGQAYGLNSKTWGTTASEWKNIPEMLKLKDGALVMILSNSPVQTEEEWRYANGDLGHVKEKDASGVIWVTLLRNGKTIPIMPIVRHKSEREPAGFEDKAIDKCEHIFCTKECGLDDAGKRWGAWGEPTFNCAYGTWNVGAIKYYPLRLAYATTIHKSQGLSLDACQIDCRDPFFGSPSMAYVALSRCKTPEGLTIVGDPTKLAERVKTDPKVKRWL